MPERSHIPWVVPERSWAVSGPRSLAIGMLSWISISLRSPSIFFLSLMASFLLLTSESRVLCMDSMTLWLFLLICSISSSFSASFLSISPLTWFSSAGHGESWTPHAPGCPLKKKNIYISDWKYALTTQCMLLAIITYQSQDTHFSFLQGGLHLRLLSLHCLLGLFQLMDALTSLT